MVDWLAVIKLSSSPNIKGFNKQIEVNNSSVMRKPKVSLAEKYGWK